MLNGWTAHCVIITLAAWGVYTTYIIDDVGVVVVVLLCFK